jgi:hydroxyacylglutathione hydrolase
LFSCGCGRVFDDTPARLHASLGRLAGLPGETLVHPAHEYTRANLAFARHVDPGNPDLTAWEVEVEARRSRDEPTLPVRLADELRRNPFLRCADPGLTRRIEALAG